MMKATFPADLHLRKRALILVLTALVTGAIFLSFFLGFLREIEALPQKAQDWGKLAAHPGKGVKPFKALCAKTRFLSEEEEAAIVAVCTPALRRIDLARKTVSVAACYAKSGESRPLPIGTCLHTVLAEALTQRGDAPTIFVKDSCAPWTPDAFAYAFAVACQRAGLELLHPHVL